MVAAAGAVLVVTACGGSSNSGDEEGEESPATATSAVVVTTAPETAVSPQCLEAWQDVPADLLTSGDSATSDVFGALFGPMNANTCDSLDEWAAGARAASGSDSFFGSPSPAEWANIACSAASPDAYEILRVCQDARDLDPAGAP